jgi:zinc finger protein
VWRIPIVADTDPSLSFSIDFGLIYTVKVLLASDLNRQLVKSPYCTITIPEIELTIPPGKGNLTTIEGLIASVIEDLSPEQPLRRIHPKWNMREYKRSREDNILLGLASEDDAQGAQTGDEAAGEKLDMDEVFVFPGRCSSCSKPLDTKMKRVNIPYFKEIIIMSTNCEACGYRDNEVKSSGAVSAQGKRITLKIEDSDDLSRDILKVGSFVSHFHQV